MYTLERTLCPLAKSFRHSSRRYGPPGPHSIAGLFLIFAFPTAGTLIGLVARFVFVQGL